jgi:Cdc6-like AAA superfamily ATPase
VKKRAPTQRELQIIRQQFDEALRSTHARAETKNKISGDFRPQAAAEFIDSHSIDLPRTPIVEEGKSPSIWRSGWTFFASADLVIAATSATARFTSHRYSLLFLLGITGGILIAVCGFIVAVIRYIGRLRAMNDRQDAETYFKRVVWPEVRAFAYEKVHDGERDNKPKAREAEEYNPELVLPALDGADLVEQVYEKILPVPVIESCQAFIESHKASAIGITGPRGIGKTTVLTELYKWADGKFDFASVYLPVPVKYSATDFVRTIHEETALALLSDRVMASVDSLARLQRLAWYIVSGLIVYCAAGISVWACVMRPKTWPAFPVWMVIAGSSGLVALFFMLAALGRQAKFRHGIRTLRKSVDISAEELAQTELEKLPWSTTTQSSQKSVFSFKGFSREDSAMKELAERESTQLQRVNAFRQFIDNYCESEPGRKVVIALDELDKLSSAEEAIEVINGIKDLMHIPGAHFVVAVAEDALARFALRGIPVRDAFDSTFDTIIAVPSFTIQESKELLGKRVNELPDVLSYFCYVLSAGIPRDLIRHARECVDIGRKFPGVSTSTVVAKVTKRHVLSLLDAAVFRLSGEGGSAGVITILELKRVLASRTGGEVFQFLDSAAESFAQDKRLYVEGGLPPLAVVLATIGTAGSYFGQAWKLGAWTRAMNAGDPDQCARTAAICMAAAASDTCYAVKRLGSLREALDLRSLTLLDREPKEVGAPGRNPSTGRHARPSLIEA